MTSRPKERIAVFDNDGTLWCEKPMPIQADFLFRRLADMAEADPSLRDRQPWKAVVEKDFDWLGGALAKHYQGDDSNLKVMAGGLLQAYEGATIEEFESTAAAFMHSARHPTLDRSYLECAFLPMVELLDYLAANGFTNYIASGGGRDFMRVSSQELYGIPPDRVIGSTVALEYRESGDMAQIVHTAKPDILDDGPAKPVRIWSRIGRTTDRRRGQLERRHPDAAIRLPTRPAPRSACSFCTTIPTASSTTPRARRTPSSGRRRRGGRSSASRTTGRPSSRGPRRDDADYPLCSERTGPRHRPDSTQTASAISRIDQNG